MKPEKALPQTLEDTSIDSDEMYVVLDLPAPHAQVAGAHLGNTVMIALACVEKVVPVGALFAATVA